jgi:hypothetical protein
MRTGSTSVQEVQLLASRDQHLRSERPAFELHYPQLVARQRTKAHTGRGATAVELASQEVGAAPQPRPTVTRIKPEPCREPGLYDAGVSDQLCKPWP